MLEIALKYHSVVGMPVIRPNILMRVLVRFCLVACLCCQALASEQDVTPRNWQHGFASFDEFKYSPGFHHFDYVNPDAPKGGRLVRAIATSFNSFTPFIDKGISAPGWSTLGEMTLYDSLIWDSGDEIGVYYGNLAEWISINDDMTEVRIRLRPEARWHDGVPVSARDVQFTLEHIRDHAFGINSILEALKEVVVIGEKEVLFRYRYPITLNSIGIGRIAILPEHYWRERDISQTTVEPPLSSGPYRIGKFEMGRFIEFERVEDYWGKDLGLHRGRHNFDVLRYEVYRDNTVQREAFRKGLLDVLTEPNAAQWVTGYGIGQADLLLQERHPSAFMGVTSALAFNLTEGRFQDVRVREALSLVFDFDWMNAILDHGAREKPKSYFHGSVLAATGLPSEDELKLLEAFRDQLPPRVFTEPPFSGSSLSGLDRRESTWLAQRLLRQAGFEYRDGELVDADGAPFEIEFLVVGLDQQRRLLPYVDRLKRLGIVGRIRLVESAQYISLRRKKKGDAVFGSLIVSMPPRNETLVYLGSNSKGTRNFAHLNSPVVDNLLGHLVSAPSQSALIAAGRALDRVLYWQFYFVPVQLQEPTNVAVWNKFGRPSTQPTYVSGFPDTWWWDPALADRVEESLAPNGPR